MACASRTSVQAPHEKKAKASDSKRKAARRWRKHEEPTSDEGDSWHAAGSHPRRWSPEEDERLRASVEKHHGTNWKDIAAEVKTRNHVQCLQRWKKVLTPGLVKGQWSRREDDLLTSLVNEGHKNWGTLATRIPGRTSKQCRERWCHHLDPRIVKGEWTQEEDSAIVSLHEEMGNKWATIAQHLDGRTENATKIRWKILERCTKPGQEAHKMDKVARGSPRQGDTRLRCLAAKAAASAMSMSKTNKLMSTVGLPEDPAAVNKVLKQRFEDSEPPRRFSYTHNAQEPPVACATTPFTSSTNRPSSEPVGRPVECQASKKRKTPGGNLQCPSASVESDGGPPKQKRGGGRREGQCGRRGWLPEEDERLRQAVKRLGERNWRYVAESVGTRTHIQCQQRWKKALRPGLVKGAWSLEEDENLVTLIGEGFANWSELATHTPGRTAKQCRERWCHHLDPSVNHGNWTEEEDQVLCALEARLGTKWAAIAREMPGRTEHAVKGRSKTLSREKRVGATGFRVGRVGKGVTLQKNPMQKTQVVGGTSMPLMGAVQPRSLSMSQSAGLDCLSSLGADVNAVGDASGMAPLPLLVRPTSASTLPKERPPSAGLSESATVMNSGKLEAQVGEKEDQRCSSNGNRQQLVQPHFGHFPPPQITAATGLQKPTNGAMMNAQHDGMSIARLLSVSSGGTEADAVLPEIVSGCCGSGNPAASKHPSLTAMPSPHSIVESPLAMPQAALAAGMGLNHQQHQHQDPGRLQARGVVNARGVLPPYPAAEDKLFLPLNLDEGLCPPRLNTGLMYGASSAADPSSLVNKPSVVDYSDLASILMVGFTPRQDGVGAGNEFVTLGDEDPYSDYSFSGNNPYIMQCPTAPASQIHAPASGKCESAALAAEQQEAAGFGDVYDEVAGVPSELAEALAAGVFDAGDPCDPYF